MIQTNAWSMPNVQKNDTRGDIYVRDVYNRNTVSSFAGDGYSDRSTLYINENDEAIPCTSEVSTLKNGLGDLHIYTRDGYNFNKANVAQAALSINAVTTTFRSSNTHVTGGFTVGATLRVGSQNVGVSTSNPQFTLDVGGDCNVRGGSVYRINGAPVLSSTALGPSVTTSSLSATAGDLETLTVSGNITQTAGVSNLRDVNVTGNLSVNGAPVTYVNGVSVEPMSAEYGTDTPFLYNGPGNDLSNGVPFYAFIERRGAAFVSSSGFFGSYTFSQGGTYVVQAEVRGGYPWLPEGDVLTYFVKNGIVGKKLGLETHEGGSLFGCSKSYVMTVAATDSIQFIIESATTNEFSAGIDSCKITFVRVQGSQASDSPTGNVETGTMSTLIVSGNVSAGNVDVSGDLSVAGNLTVNGAQWASTVVYGTTTPFMYTGPGAAYGNGVSFFLETRANGTAFVTGGGMDNSVFTFSTGGTYMLQAEVEVGYPLMPGGDITTYFLVNGNASERFGMDSHAPSNFSCTRPYLLTVDASDNVRFIVDSSSGNEYEVGLNTARWTMLKLA